MAFALPAPAVTFLSVITVLRFVELKDDEVCAAAATTPFPVFVAAGPMTGAVESALTRFLSVVAPGMTPTWGLDRVAAALPKDPFTAFPVWPTDEPSSQEWVSSGTVEPIGLESLFDVDELLEDGSPASATPHGA
jgi:hypothetical protein